MRCSRERISARLRALSVNLAVLLVLWGGSAAQAQIGEICQPGDWTPRPGISCQATDEFDFHGPYVHNAMRGDILLSADCGLIGGLLRQLPGNAEYSHSGIMVEDRLRVRHSTAAEDRTRLDAGSDGFVLEYIKWGWPGTLTETIEAAYEGDYQIDPDGVPYHLRSFSASPLASCMDDPVAIPPVVVRPLPGTEDLPLPGTGESVRSALDRVATEAEAIDGHYRFFAYTDADLVGRTLEPGELAPPEAGWAHFDGPSGTVCSQLIWSAARAAGVPLEDSAEEAGDRPHASTALKEGLYLYSASDRALAGTWLYNQVYDAFYEESGWLGRLFTDAPDDGGNQLLNCFAYDWCGDEPSKEWDGDTNSKDSSRWRDDPRQGIAVAPDDITQWDGYPGGLYGRQERMSYRPGSYRSIHRWAASQGTGTIEAIVVFNGAPINGVEVELPGYETQTTRGLSASRYGAVRFEAVEAGTLELFASTELNDRGTIVPVQGSALVQLGAGQTETVYLNLQANPQPPPNTPARREVQVRGTIGIVDGDWPDGDDRGAGAFDHTVILEPDVPGTPGNESVVNLPLLTHCRDEVRGDTVVTLELDPSDYSINVVLDGRLYEAGGGSCGGNDQEDHQRAGLRIAEDGRETTTLHLADGGDSARFQMTIENRRAPVP